MSDLPFVSVIVSALNAEKYIKEAIDSVLAQTHQHFELILIDDGSTDSTLEIYKKYAAKDPRIVIDSHENMGMGNSVNRALKLAKGELVARMDADDIMLKKRLEVQAAFLKKHPEIALASCLTEFIGDKGHSIGVQDFPQTSDLLTKKDTERYVAEKKCIHFAHTGTMFRKSIVQKAGGYSGKYWPSDDIELFNRVADHGHGVVIIPEKLMKYRLHGSSIIGSKFYTSIIKSHWVEDCILKRRMGVPELTFSEYEKKFNSRPLLQRIKSRRNIYANNYFRNAGIELSNKNYLKFIRLILLSMALRPLHISSRVLKKAKAIIK